MTLANWCLLVVILLPYVWFGVASSASKGQRDNDNPREFLTKAQGRAQRALGAHSNTFETNIGFIAAVLVAQMAHGNQVYINLLAALYVAARVLYGLFYLANKGGARSMMFSLGLLCTIGLFVVGAVS